VLMRAVVHKRPVVLAAVKDLGGSGFPGGLGALQYTKNSHKPEASLKNPRLSERKAGYRPPASLNKRSFWQNGPA
jgi:hypothetical protein